MDGLVADACQVGEHQTAYMAFCDDVDRFLEAFLTDEMRAAGRATIGQRTHGSTANAWREALFAKGWIAPSWPIEHGGAGWSIEQRRYFETACAARDAPVLHSSGVRTIGPLIIAHGRPDQREDYLPPILDGSHAWCQGFSEPQAGSDLSNLSLKATRDGDDFILSGSKIWTSYAHEATHMFLLARSEAGSQGSDGLVFLLIEMNRPGIDVRPIRFIDGAYETNQVFFDGVRTPVRDRIGDIGAGWKTAKNLMAIARSNNTTTGVLRRAFRSAWRSANEAGSVTDEHRRAFGALALRLDSFEALEARVASGHVGVHRAAGASVLKVVATELHQAITTCGLDAAPQCALAQSHYLSTRAATIYSGTSEVHRNILAGAIGCPRAGSA